ncbi:MAG: dissimilatory-type sulfite reductase subunit alpha [Chloroflexi bacterium]|nr:dissimilatory-type sulfite reductase subunit alpha [Chloroflexota bacterium]
MAEGHEEETPLLDELEQGSWPSFVTEIKRMAERNEAARDLLGQLELSYKDKVTHWKHGGIVGVKGYGGGVIGRYSDCADRFPAVNAFHTFRVNQPAGWFYTTKALRELCDIWEKHGSGLTNFHGSTGDIILLGTTTENIQPCFDALTGDAGFDLGGSGSDLRTPSCCVGPARCEYSCIDTLDLCDDLTRTFQDELHRPRWPYKFKVKIAGCPNDCVASIARSDLPIIGTWRDSLRIDQGAVRQYVADGLDIKADVVDRCPTRALEWDGAKLDVRPEDCVRCMHCINRMPKAIQPGVQRGATVLIGGKAPIVKSALLSWVIVPFMPVTPPYTELKELMQKIWDWWDENAHTRERIGELIDRLGMKSFLNACGLKPTPQMVFRPRSNPYFF